MTRRQLATLRSSVATLTAGAWILGVLPGSLLGQADVDKENKPEPAQKAAAAPAYRTDAIDPSDEELKWYSLVDGEFPPEGAAHYFSGELIGLDHVNREAILRVDRTDAQSRSHWDLPVAFSMLPYGSVAYRGAPAALRDVPIGTHLHGWFFEKREGEEGTAAHAHNRRSIEADFIHCLRLEDDFSYYRARGERWRIESIDGAENKLHVRLMRGSEATDEAGIFDLLPSTRIWKGSGLGTLEDLAPRQEIQVNLTWATLYGDGRARDIWLDEKSRESAAAHQREIHLQHQKERGLAGWIDAVDNRERTLTVTLFGGVDPELLGAFKAGSENVVTCVVAENSLRTHDQVNDRKRGPLLEVKQVSPMTGGSGVQLRFKQDLLLEGFRPGRVVRVFAPGWAVVTLPKEENLWPQQGMRIPEALLEELKEAETADPGADTGP